MAKYHGKCVPRPGEHFQTDSTPSKNIWKDFEKFENFHPTKTFFNQFICIFKLILTFWRHESPKNKFSQKIKTI